MKEILNVYDCVAFANAINGNIIYTVSDSGLFYTLKIEYKSYHVLFIK